MNISFSMTANQILTKYSALAKEVGVTFVKERRKDAVFTCLLHVQARLKASEILQN